ncbi:cytochrome c oxidase subunit CcoM [Pseudomonas sp. PDM16]|nr:cytochrome c oxidase subunit CcoM [Pseudomonas sp. PDM16]
MFLDTVVLAGIGTVALMFVFFGGFGLFIWKDSHKKAKAAAKAE